MLGKGKHPAFPRAEPASGLTLFREDDLQALPENVRLKLWPPSQGEGWGREGGVELMTKNHLNNSSWSAYMQLGQNSSFSRDFTMRVVPMV